jgi:cell division protein FtsB
MNRAGNSYWLSNRQLTQHAVAQALPALSARELTREIFPATLGLVRTIPSWVVLAMILTATVGICSTVTMRSRSELKASAEEFGRMSSEIEAMRRSNASLQVEIRRMATDPVTIESAARERLGMVRPTDIIVPMESISKTSSLGTLSFVR